MNNLNLCLYSYPPVLGTTSRCWSPASFSRLKTALIRADFPSSTTTAPGPLSVFGGFFFDSSSAHFNAGVLQSGAFLTFVSGRGVDLVSFTGGFRCVRDAVLV